MPRFSQLPWGESIPAGFYKKAAAFVLRAVAKHSPPLAKACWPGTGLTFTPQELFFFQCFSSNNTQLIELLKVFWVIIPLSPNAIWTHHWILHSGDPRRWWIRVQWSPWCFAWRSKDEDRNLQHGFPTKKECSFFSIFFLGGLYLYIYWQALC